MKNDGGPAFARAAANRPGENFTHRIPEQRGMTIRDWFAGKALAGLVASHYENMTPHADIANDCYAQADAMLTERGDVTNVR